MEEASTIERNIETEVAKQEFFGSRHDRRKQKAMKRRAAKRPAGAELGKPLAGKRPKHADNSFDTVVSHMKQCPRVQEAVLSGKLDRYLRQE